jgi:hypothetical protein
MSDNRILQGEISYNSSNDSGFVTGGIVSWNSLYAKLEQSFRGSHRFQTKKALFPILKNTSQIGTKTSAFVDSLLKFRETGSWKKASATFGSSTFLGYSTEFAFKNSKINPLLRPGIEFGIGALYADGLGTLLDVTKHKSDNRWFPKRTILDGGILSPKMWNSLLKTDKVGFNKYQQLQNQQQLQQANGNLGNLIGNAASWIMRLFGKGKKFHSGGTVPGRGEIMALLQGGETVRTEEQERAIQEALMRKHSNNQENNSGQKNNKNSLLPRLSKEDDQYIIGLVADAYKRNRYGFRTVLRS